MEPVLDAKKKRLFNKIISTLISVIFIFSSFLTPDLAFAKVTNSHSIQDLGAYSPDSAPQFKIANISIHKDNGLIKDLFQGTNGKLIVHIQDAHVNYEGQKSLARILENLIEEHGIELVLVEGGFGDVGLSSLRYFSTQKRREEIADTYLKKGMIAGEEYLDIISDFRQASSLPVAAYNVSGEYAAVKLLAEAGLVDEGMMVMENLTAIKRAGADIIVTYHLRDISKEGWHNG